MPIDEDGADKRRGRTPAAVRRMIEQTDKTTGAGECEGGYLLIEVLIASALLLVALLAIMPLYTISVRQNAFAKDLTVASSLAYDKAEEFARWDCDNIRRGTCCLEAPSAHDSSGACADEPFTIEG